MLISLITLSFTLFGSFGLTIFWLDFIVGLMASLGVLKEDCLGTFILIGDIWLILS